MKRSTWVVQLLLCGAVVSCAGGKKDKSDKAGQEEEGGGESDAATEIDPQLADVFKSFEADAELYGLKKDPLREQGLKSFLIEAPRDPDGSVPDNVVGRCYLAVLKKAEEIIGYDNRVVISPEAKLKLRTEDSAELTSLMVKYVSYHELGHCLGGLKHTDESLPRKGLAFAMMDAFVPSAKVVASVPWEKLMEEFAETWNAGK